jgi:hypothetical protein
LAFGRAEQSVKRRLFTFRRGSDRLPGIAKRRRIDVKDMTDDELRSLIAAAGRRERWMPGGFSTRREGWTAMRTRGETELARRSQSAERS